MSFTVRCDPAPDGALALTLTKGEGSAALNPSLQRVSDALLKAPPGARVVITGSQDLEMDSPLLAWLFSVAQECIARQLVFSISQMPEQVQRQLALALSVPERKGARRSELRASFLEAVGRASVSLRDNLVGWFSFLGELVVAVWQFVRGRARVPVRDIWVTMDECGPGALPIVTLISSLVGVILAFIGAQQLRQFGAQIYVANLVSVAMLREMGAVMAGVIMAGRTGAAFAAQLGTMQVNEEIDALKTLGISPMQYLVVPRVIALIVMMPLLCLYADMLGILGGAVVSALTMDISFVQFFQQAATAVHLSDLWLGVSKSCIFGVLIAIAGCLSGIRCGRSASAVGIAVTSAVVSGIVAIVLSDAVFAVITEVLGM
jgi:phospholipid/cholesterol/gamma-HCH transport system permease protein